MEPLPTSSNPTFTVATLAAGDLICDRRVICEGKNDVGVRTEPLPGGLHVFGRATPNLVLHSGTDALRLDTPQANILIAFSLTGKFERILFRILDASYRPMREFVIRPEDQGEKLFQFIWNRSPACILDFNIVGDDIDLVLSDLVILCAAEDLLQSRDNAVVSEALGKARPGIDLAPIPCDLKLLWVEITSRCNLRCKSCEKFYGQGRPWEDMDIDLFRHIADSLFPHTRSLSLTGIGEPLHHRQADEVFSIIEKYPDLVLDFVSNGELWTDVWLDRIGTFDAKVALSLEGPNEEMHRFNRGPKANFKKVVALLDESRARAARDPGFRLRFSLNMVVMRNNILAMPDMVRFAAEHGVGMLVFILMGYWGQDRDWYEQQSPYHMNDVYAEKYEEAKELGRNLGVNVILPPPAAPASGGPGAPHRFQDCSVPFDSLYIHFNGRVSPCCAMRPYINGNIRDYAGDEMATLWNSARQKLLRAEMRQRSYNHLCLHCDLNYGINAGRPADSTGHEAFPIDMRVVPALEQQMVLLQAALRERDARLQQFGTLTESIGRKYACLDRQIGDLIELVQGQESGGAPVDLPALVQAMRTFRAQMK